MGSVNAMSEKEVISLCSRHFSLRATCIFAFRQRITNKVVMAGDEDETDHGAVANHEEVLDAVNQRAKEMQDLVKKTVEIIGKEILPTLPDLPLVSLAVPSTISSLLSDKKHLAWSAMLVAGGALVGVAMSRKR